MPPLESFIGPSTRRLIDLNLTGSSPVLVSATPTIPSLACPDTAQLGDGKGVNHILRCRLGK